MDVVPVENAARWEHPPFDADMDGDYIYGRGTLDDKVRPLARLALGLFGNRVTWRAAPFSLHIPSQFGIFSILENMEDMLQRNGADYRPKRTIIVAFGHDEEVSGMVRRQAGPMMKMPWPMMDCAHRPSFFPQDGAFAVGRLLEKRKEKVAFLLDEGLPISHKLVR